MADDKIRYDMLTQDALRGVVRTVLQQIARTGLPGEHHLYIAFDTHAPGVSVSERLQEQYPEEMTIVLQHQFWDLEIYQDRFEVKLSFNNIPERLVVPLAAIKAFYDPSVQFGLQFGSQDAANDGPPEAHNLPATIDGNDDARGLPAVADGTGGNSADTHQQAEQEPQDTPIAEVVELDAFRRK